MLDAIATADVGTGRWWLVNSDAGWRDALGRFSIFDTYHLKAYHRAASGGQAHYLLFFQADDGACCALPFVVRSLAGIAGGCWNALNDSSSVYGYPGLLAEGRDTPGLRQGLLDALRAAMRTLGVVSLFVRQNPLIGSDALWEGIGDLRVLGPTVLIDVTQEPARRRADYSQNHRRTLSRNAKLGIEVRRADLAAGLEVFMPMYIETMKRVDAEDSYFFGEAYFRAVGTKLGEHAAVFLAERLGDVCGAALLFQCGTILQYHLGARRRIEGNVSPMVAIFDAVCDWAHEAGYKQFHLGGGVGAASDNLLRFKQGFSKETREFSVVRAVFDREAHEKICAANLRWRAVNGLRPPAPGFFPPYRAPAERA